MHRHRGHSTLSLSVRTDTHQSLYAMAPSSVFRSCCPSGRRKVIDSFLVGRAFFLFNKWLLFQGGGRDLRVL